MEEGLSGRSNRNLLIVAVIVLIAIVPLNEALAETYTIPDAFSFSYPQEWQFSTRAFKANSGSDSFWLCMAFSKNDAIEVLKSARHSDYGFLSLKDAEEETFEKIRLAHGNNSPASDYLYIVRSSVDDTPFFIYSFTDMRYNYTFYEAFTLVNGWEIVFHTHKNQPMEARRNADTYSLQVLLDTVRSFKSVAVPMPREGDFYYTIEEGQAIIKGYCGNGSTASVPDMIAGCLVTGIGDHAFSGCTSLNEIILPSTISTIGDYAFSQCENLGEIKIPAGVTNIPQYAFYCCFDLKDVSLPDTVTSLGDSSFEACSSLEGISLPEALADIGKETFNSCRKLKTLLIPASVKMIGEGVFNLCPRLTEIHVDSLSKNYKSIEGILYDISGNTLLECPEGITGHVYVPKGITSIGKGAFTYCDINEVTMHQGLIRIESEAFTVCRELVKAEIPMSVSSIHANAFDAPKLLVIHGYEGSLAQKYAQKKGISFAPIEKAVAISIRTGDREIGSEALVIDLASGSSSVKFTAYILPVTAKQDIVWKSSKPEVASVDQDGFVVNLKPGKATITATADDGSKVKASFNLKVTILAKELSITGSASVKAGKQTALKVVMLPADTLDKKVAWSSSDSTAATVSSNGVVTAKKVSEIKTVTITAAANDASGVFAEFMMTVTP